MKKGKQIIKNCFIFLLVFTLLIPKFKMQNVQAATLSAPKSITVKNYGKTGARVSWKSVTGAKGYRVYRKTAGQSWKRIRTVSKCQTITDSGLKMGERYYYTVRAYKSINGKTQWSSYNKKGISVIAGLSYLKLNKSLLSLQVGKSAALKINGTKLKPSWTSKNPSIASVKNGKVVAKKTGTTTITAKLGGKTFSCKVTCGTSSAANKDVTKKYKSQVSKMLKNFDSYFGYGCAKGRQFKFDDYARTTMVYFSNLGKIYGKTIQYAQAKLGSQMKLYFGNTTVKLKQFKQNNTGYALPENPSYLIQNQGGKIIYVGGDWGDVYPVGAIKKIEQTSSNKFVATYRMDFYCEYEKKYYGYMGTYKVYLSKANNKNGFIITNIVRAETMNVNI